MRGRKGEEGKSQRVKKRNAAQSQRPASSTLAALCNPPERPVEALSLSLYHCCIRITTSNPTITVTSDSGKATVAKPPRTTTTPATDTRL